MMEPGPESDALKRVIGILSSLKGVRHAFVLTRSMRSELEKIERGMVVAGPVPVKNQGVMECLRREHVVCIVKDRSFRPPPRPTVQLVDADGRVIGWELLPGEKAKHPPGAKVLYLGKDFVICYDGKGGRNACFVLPPVPFKEVEELEGMRNVCSSSPSSVGDLFLKRSVGLHDDPKLASILIGFDLR